MLESVSKLNFKEMKAIKYIKALGVAALASMMLTACTGDQAMPPLELPEELGDQAIGNGTWDNPMAAYMAALGRIPTNEYGEMTRQCWVTGYIVGWVNTDISFTEIELSATFSVPATVSTNIMIASRSDETDPTKIATVQLPSGDLRKALNLVDNPDNLGELVTIYGTVGRAYCGQNGVREVSAFKWGDKGIEPDPYLIEELNPMVDITGFTFEQTYTSDPGYTTWNQDTKYGLVAKAYNGTSNVETDATAITPFINLRGRKTAEVNIHQAANYFGGVEGFNEMCTTMVREEGATEWTVLTLPNPPSGNSWTYGDSGKIDISEYVGKKVQFGFRYTSTMSVAGTWEIDRITVTGEKSE